MAHPDKHFSVNAFALRFHTASGREAAAAKRKFTAQKRSYNFVDREPNAGEDGKPELHGKPEGFRRKAQTELAE